MAILALHTPPYKPLDVILTYSHSNLQNSSLTEFASAFSSRAKVGQVITASPLNMGLLTPKPPSWHPAPKSLLEAVEEVNQQSAQWDGGLPNIALGYAAKVAMELQMPLVVGLSSLKEVHEVCSVWSQVDNNARSDERTLQEDAVRGIFEQAGFLDWSWSSTADP